MPANTRLTNLSDYKSTLPYNSELFGVYQPMLGWKGKRNVDRHFSGLIDIQNKLLGNIAKNYIGIATVNDPAKTCELIIQEVQIGKLSSMSLILDNPSALIQGIISMLPKNDPPKNEKWLKFIEPKSLKEILNSDLFKKKYQDAYLKKCKGQQRNELMVEHVLFKENQQMALLKQTEQAIELESALAASLLDLVENKQYSVLEKIFYSKRADISKSNKAITEILNQNDPFATFNPSKDIKDVCLSPLGVVHLFRQYFFELDTFLGTPVGHVWLSPGSSVELIEVSTRRVYIEKTIEQSIETTKKSESSETDKDEISEAVKEENKSDLKLGASVTANQSWGTGNITATASLNMQKTQDVARETSHKRMREQSSKLSSEIKQNYKSTFKTITETTDTSSKRYVLKNDTSELINYELRRKMRQVGVQVQDVGTYLCWEGFVDDPGNGLGLPNLVHIAKPDDLDATPQLVDIDEPKTDPLIIQTKATFAGSENKYRGENGFINMANITLGLNGIPDLVNGTEIDLPFYSDKTTIIGSREGIIIQASQGSGTDYSPTNFEWKGKISSGKNIEFGIHVGAGITLDWDKNIDFDIIIKLPVRLTDAEKNKIQDEKLKNATATTNADIVNKRKLKETYLNAVKDRIEMASKIDKRSSEDLREEERIIIYRNLITQLTQNLPTILNSQTKHTISELLNSIFDIDKMLYFVAPEWWNPRRLHSNTYLSSSNYDNDFSYTEMGAKKLTTSYFQSWSDQTNRLDNYYITEKSNPARMGSSLGWLMQLDGDDLRNAFLNAPWVKTVIPIRPGKELEAINWLQQNKVEGTDGLDAVYQAPQEEIDKIKETMGIESVTIGDAIKYLCIEVAAKHNEGKTPSDIVIDDRNTVNATPVDKVYEHGFYPLQHSFRAESNENFEVFDQWVEVLPTDQIAPVEVKYDPKTGRQI